jgi:hypothetical protein
MLVRPVCLGVVLYLALLPHLAAEAEVITLELVVVRAAAAAVQEQTIVVVQVRQVRAVLAATDE